jgi:hypothetical protein
VIGFFEDGNEPYESIKVRDFVNSYHMLKKTIHHRYLIIHKAVSNRFHSICCSYSHFAVSSKS